MRLWSTLVLAAGLYGQADVATVTGVVADTGQAVMPGVSVTLRNIETNSTNSVASNNDGYFTLTPLPPGTYELTAARPGFSTYRVTRIALESGQTLRHDIVMQLGSVSETVSVQAEVAVLNTENGAINGDVIVQQEIQDMPLNGRDFTDLAFLVPGVLPNAQGGSGSGMAINGARGDNTNFYLDGMSDRNSRGGAAQFRPNIDALEEFKMEVGGFSAEYGRMAGGILNMTLKSGTNQYHGTLFEYLRNDVFDARAFFDNGRLPLHQNQFGGTVSGPVRLPKYNGRDRTFFLLSMESYRYVQGQSRIGNVATPLERAGDFTQSIDVNGRQIQVKDPLNKNAVFPGDRIPASRYSPVALNLLKIYPVSNRSNPQDNYYATANSRSSWDSFVTKIDQRFSIKDSISLRYGKRFGRNNAPWAAAAAGGSLGLFQNWVQDDRSLGGFDWNHMFTPSLITDIRIGFSRNSSREHAIGGGVDMAAQIGMQGSTKNPEVMGMPLINITNFLPIGYAANQPVQYFVTDYQVGDKTTWIRGKHVLKFGVDLSKSLFNQPYNNNSRGTMTANGIWTGGGTAANGDAFGDLLLGLLNTSSITANITRNYLRFNSYGAFVNDDFKAGRSLTLNIGLRYEIDQPPHDKYDRMMNFVPSLNRLVVADRRAIPNFDALVADAGLTGRVVSREEYGLPHSLVYANYKNFAPRLGFAWRPWGAQKTVLRGGYGIFYSGNVLNDVRLGLGTSFPFSTNLSFSRIASDPSVLTLATPWPVSRQKLADTNTSTGFQLHAPTGYLQSYSLTIEREVGRQTTLVIAYVGSKGTHLGRQYNLNMPFRTLEYYQLFGSFPVPYPPLSTIDYWDFGSNSIYNAGQVTLRKRARGGTLVSLNYIFSKSIDNASQLTGDSDGGFAQALDSRNLRLERARSDWDRGHSLTGVVSWRVPVGSGQKLLAGSGRLANGVLGGWQFSSTTQAVTGQPLTIKDSTINQAVGESSRPNRIASGQGPAGDGRRGIDFRWYDPQAFSEVPGCASRTNCKPDAYGFIPFAPGNSGRNILDGPGLFYINMSFMKNYSLGERRRVQFRWETFNVLNRPNFKLPNRNFNETSAGLLDDVLESGRGGPRVMQFALKYYF